MKYKIGDKVRVKENIEEFNVYDGISVSKGMTNLRGKEFIVEEIKENGYKLEGSLYLWTDEMLDNTYDLLSYALEKLEMTKKELEDEMKLDDSDKEWIKHTKKLIEEAREYCEKQTNCKKCKIGQFKRKYNILEGTYCDYVFRYLKDKGKI